MMEMRRKDRKLTDEEAYQILQEAEYGVLSTVDEQGMPYGVPMSFSLEDGVIYMHCAKADGQKISNIKHCSKASFTTIAHTELLPEAFATKYMSAIAFGNVEIAETEEEKIKGLIAILKKYSPEYMESGMEYIKRAFEQVYVLKFVIKQISGKGKKA